MNENKKLALLFLIYDEINQEELWHDWLKYVDKNKYSIHIHYKTEKKLKYFEEYKVKNCIETSWGALSLVKAQNILLRNALKDTDNTNFIILSNSCVPLKSFEHVCNFLNKDKSHFNLCSKDHVFPRYDKVAQFIDSNDVQKTHAWCALSRKHAEILSNDEHIYAEWFDGIELVDESAYITYLYHCKLQNELILTNDSLNNGITFVNWRDKSYKFFENGTKLSGSGPNTYFEISNEELDFLTKESACLFGRKFASSCDLSYLKKII